LEEISDLNSFPERTATENTVAGQMWPAGC